MTYPHDTENMAERQNKDKKKTSKTRQIFKNERSQIASYEWSPEESELINWFMGLREFPRLPFELRKGVRIVDFFISLREEIERGPNQYRARHGLIRQDLLDLRRVIEGVRDGK